MALELIYKFLWEPTYLFLYEDLSVVMLDKMSSGVGEVHCCGCGCGIKVLL